MNLMNFVVGQLQTNCYVLHNDTEAICIDPGDEASKILDYLKKHHVKLTHILCTHLHVDHVGANQELAEATGAPILASERDAFLLRSEMGLGGAYGLPRIKPYTFQNLDEGDLKLLHQACTVLATPGHTPGGLCFYFPEQRILFAGDTLFFRSVGRTDFPKGNPEQLMHSITEILFSLPGDTRVLPGHGMMTTIGDEKGGNPFLTGETTLDHY